MSRLYDIFREHPVISTDSRDIAPNSIFFALRGESFDGNLYAQAAIEGGAAWAVVDDADIYRSSASSRMMWVEDVLSALQSLANEHRRALGIEILAITGSNGKTTTKELLAAVLATKFKLYATRGNFNNHIGVPLTLLSMDESVEFGVVEMGASSCSEIELLCSIAEPNYGLITNVGRAHLEGFGGESGVRRGKGELLDYLAKSGGKAFVACEDKVISSMAEEREGLEIIPYSYDLAEGVEHNLEGEYNRYNVAAAIAVGRYFGVDNSLAFRAIADYEPTNNRSQRMENGRNTLIVDCYNANPSSMQAALTNFANEIFDDRSGKVAILGDMFELGEWAEQEHERVIERALSGDVERVILVGKNFSAIASKRFSKEGRIESFECRAELEDMLRESPIEGAALLIKGSRGVGLERIIALL